MASGSPCTATCMKSGAPRMSLGMRASRFSLPAQEHSAHLPQTDRNPLRGCITCWSLSEDRIPRAFTLGNSPNRTVHGNRGMSGQGRGEVTGACRTTTSSSESPERGEWRSLHNSFLGDVAQRGAVHRQGGGKCGRFVHEFAGPLDPLLPGRTFQRRDAVPLRGVRHGPRQAESRQGLSRTAQRFNAGNEVQQGPESRMGRQNACKCTPFSFVPAGTRGVFDCGPTVETVGYCLAP